MAGLRTALARRGLSLAGGWVDLPFAAAAFASLAGFEDAPAFAQTGEQPDPPAPPPER